MDAAEAGQVQVFLHDDFLDAGSVGVSLAPGVLASCGCVVAAVLFKKGAISATAARRLRTASVLYSSAAVIAAPFIVKLVGMLAGPALQLLQANLVPYGLSFGFVVVNLVLNEIYVFDDVKYVPVNVQPSMLLPFQSKFWSIEKRPENAAVAFKRVVQAAQKKFARESESNKANMSVVALTARKEEQKDEALLNVAMAVVFAIASSYAWQANRGTVMQVASLSSRASIPRQISLHLTQQAQRPTTQVLPQKRASLARKAQRISRGTWSLPSNGLLLSPRARWAIAIASLVALQLSQQQSVQQSVEGWLTKADLAEE
jgi:hypothetical protein